MRPDAIVALATAALYALFICGLLLILLPMLKTLLLIFKTKRRLRRPDASKLKNGAMEEHLARLLQNVSKKKQSVNGFLIFSGALFMGTLVAGLQNAQPPVAWGLAVLAGIAPYALLRIRAETISRKGSHEGEVLVAAFLNQYRISNYNVYETLEKQVDSGERFRVC
jgi:hypothetical protein